MTQKQSANRWVVLAVLFAARSTMALQYQSVAAVSPLYMERFGVSLADVGALIGIYLAPGVAFALPGGLLGRRFGDRAVVLFGMGLMMAGAVLMALVDGWTAQMVGRLLAGVGGVLLNVLMTKVVADTFSGRELATAMGIFVNSWPVGIGLGLVVLPWFGGGAPLVWMQVFLAAAILAGALALYLFVPDRRRRAAMPPAERLRGDALTAAVLAGLIWGLLNVGLAMFFAFGPALLVERGWDLTAASGATSLVLWTAAVAIPLGGYVADKTGRHDLLMYLTFAGCALVLAALPVAGSVTALFVLGGIFGSLSAGSVMALPAQALSAGNKATGMGVFFMMYYASMWVGPWLAGVLADAAGTAGAAFGLGAVAMIGCMIALFAFRRTLLRRAPAAANRRG